MRPLETARARTKAPPETDSLRVYTIETDPESTPRGVLIREWVISPEGAILPGRLVARAVTVAAARQRIPPGLALVPRLEQDPPAVIESWL